MQPNLPTAIPAISPILPTNEKSLFTLLNQLERILNSFKAIQIYLSHFKLELILPIEPTLGQMQTNVRHKNKLTKSKIQ